VKAAIASEEEYASTKGNSLAEVARARAAVEAATEVVDEAKKKHGFLSGEGSTVDVSDQSATPRAPSTEACASAVRKLSDRDLTEVRRLPNPPALARRALELVQAMIACTEGQADELPGSSTEGTPWSELQKMLARDDFVKRMLAIQPLPLSLRPKLLTQLEERWPSLKTAGKEQEQSTGNKENGGGGAKAAWQKAAAKARAESRTSNKLRAAVAAAAAAEKGGAPPGDGAKEETPMTAENVEYASRPCGAIFRFCASCVTAARALEVERLAAQAALEEALKCLQGEQQALDATRAFHKSLDDEAARRDAARKKAEADLAAACDKRLDEKVNHTHAVRALDEAKKAYEAALRQAQAEADAYEARRAENERRSKDRAARDEAKRQQQQEEMEAEAKARKKPTLVWIQEHDLTRECCAPIEFTESGSHALPNAATTLLAKVARELQQLNPMIKLHIAGHVQDDEDPTLASQRAQAVGGALIGLGVLPLRLRAKGYGATVSLSRAARTALRLKSQRRVTLHALAEVCTHEPVQFEPKETTLSVAAQKMLCSLAKLMLEQPQMKLSVEAHTDGIGDASENAHLSMARALSVVSYLEEQGVDKARFTPHGFGAAFPCDDNATVAGRQRNRRVEFLVIPDVAGAEGKHL